MTAAESTSRHEDDARLAGRHAVVTGGGSGIGAAIARRLSAAGARLTLMGRSADRLEATAGSLAGGAGVVAVDVGDPEAVGRAFARAEAAAGPVDILVNNAGIALSGPFARQDRDHWDRTIATNLTGPYACTFAVLPGMVARGWGRIVNLASTAGLKAYPYTAAYCASKHGLVGLTRALALETARSGVTVNAVCPGFTDTEIVATAAATISAKTGRTPEEARRELARTNPQGRLVLPAEVAHAVLWLCLPGTESMTGQSIVVAGGEVM